MAKTKIEWCDCTVNPVIGCSKCSEGCDGCYAERFAARLSKNPNPIIAKRYAGVVDHDGEWTGKINLDWSAFDALSDMPRKAKRIFVGSMCDIFHENLNSADRLSLFQWLHFYDKHTFYFLTKRPEEMREFFIRNGEPKPNFWAGVTVCTQKEADEKIPILLATPIENRFVSIEPMLEAIDISQYLNYYYFQCESCDHRESNPELVCPTCAEFDENNDNPDECPDCGLLHGENPISECSKCGGETYQQSPTLDWIIVGGETGADARPMHPDWVRTIRDQCEQWKKPFFFKGWGEWLPDDNHILDYEARWGAPPENPSRYAQIGVEGEFCPGHFFLCDPSGYLLTVFKVGKRFSGRTLDGREWNDVPKQPPIGSLN